MHPLSASKLLSVWEQAWPQPSVERALLLLAAACPEATAKELARLSIGQRDSLLMTLREWTFGSRLVSRVPCEKCGEPLQLTCDTSDIRVAQAVQTMGAADALSLSADGYEVWFRLPNSEDIAVAESVDIESAERFVLGRCLLRVTRDATERPVDELPQQVVDVIGERMAEADPQSDVQLALVCAVCSHNWLVTFDVVSYFWSEIGSWAHRVLREVHILASAYGWHEEEILAMSPWRRQVYLEMVGG